jgi:hypothetical protein
MSGLLFKETFRRVNSYSIVYHQMAIGKNLSETAILAVAILTVAGIVSGAIYFFLDKTVSPDAASIKVYFTIVTALLFGIIAILSMIIVAFYKEISDSKPTDNKGKEDENGQKKTV